MLNLILNIIPSFFLGIIIGLLFKQITKMEHQLKKNKILIAEQHKAILLLLKSHPGTIEFIRIFDQSAYNDKKN